MILVIDPTGVKVIKLSLLNEKGVMIKSCEKSSEHILEAIDSFLTKNKFKPSDIQAILIFEGAGPFTQSRSVAAIINVWQNVLNVKVFGIMKKGEDKIFFPKIIHKLLNRSRKKKIFIPRYSAPPNITIKKSNLKC